MKFLIGLLGGKAWLAWLLVAGVGLGALGGVYAFIDHGGYRRATLEWTVKYDKREAELNAARFKELDRQASVNAAAKALEATRLAAEMARAAALEAIILENDLAAEIDPDKDRIGLGADSVDRINRIR